jgi:hypothetical protein
LFVIARSAFDEVSPRVIAKITGLAWAAAC